MAARDHFRAHARRRVDLEATLRGRDGGVARGVKIRDLGLGGAGLEIGEGTVPVEREASVVLEVTAPTLWDPLTLRGRIAWFRRGGQGRATRAGIRFELGDSAALYALFQLLGAHGYDA